MVIYRVYIPIPTTDTIVLVAPMSKNIIYVAEELNESRRNTP